MGQVERAGLTFGTIASKKAQSSVPKTEVNA